MRLPWVALLLAACGTDEGSLLTIRSPDGPLDVARLEIVLANPDKVTSVQGQRIAPSSFTNSEAVRYYRQRATGGSIEGVGKADGFTIRIEPNTIEVPEKTFIPFLVAYDANHNVVGVGAVLGVDGEPSKITIEDGMTRKYFVDMVSLVPMDPGMGMGDRQSLHVLCGAEGAEWTSGIAWRPGPTQLRLLLANPSDAEAAGDASERETDLDCDKFAAPDYDCDDLRPAFNRGQRDLCDGVDSNCDGNKLVVQDCPLTSCVNGGGVQLCDDTTGQASSACIADSRCACAGGTCAYCTLAWKATANVDRRAPCAPGVGKMHFTSCIDGAPCTIEVLSTTAPWVGFIGASQNGPFGTKLASVTTGDAYLELKLGGTNEVMGAPGTGQGALNLLITQNGQQRLLPVNIDLAEQNPVTSCPAISGTTTFAMTCGP